MLSPWAIRGSTVEWLGKRWDIPGEYNDQLGRRNLTADQFRYYVGRKYQRAKRQGARTDLTSGQNDQKSDAATRIAAEHGTGEKTVRRAGDYARNLDDVAAVP